MMWLGVALLAWCLFAVTFTVTLVVRRIRRARRIAERRPRAVPLPAGQPVAYLSWNARRPHHHTRSGAR